MVMFDVVYWVVFNVNNGLAKPLRGLLNSLNSTVKFYP